MEEEVRKLPLTYTNDGKIMEQIKRNEYAAMYKQKDFPNYEVFRIKIRKGRIGTIKGAQVIFQTSERRPTDNDFGLWAFSYGTEEYANKRYEQLSTDNKPGDPIKHII